MKNCLLSVCIFTYNHEKYIARTLESVLSQKTTFGFNIMVIDDYSTDKTREIVDRIATSDSRIIKCYNNCNLGLNESFIKNISKIETKYICPLGGDDYWIDPEKLEKQVNLMENDKSISLVLTPFKCYDEEKGSFTDSQKTWKWKMPKDRKKRIVSFFADDWSYYPLGSTICYRNDCIQKGLKNHISFIRNQWVGEGTLTYVSICLYGDRFVAIPDITTVYTVRADSLSHRKEPIEQYNFYKGFLEVQQHVCNALKIPVKMQYRYLRNRLFNLWFLSETVHQKGLFESSLNELVIPTKLRNLFLFFSCHKLLGKFVFKILGRINI